MSTLFSPYRLRSLELPNRIVISPMCQYSAIEGRTQPWHTVHLGQLALSGAGMLIIEATAVELAGRITPGCLSLHDDATQAALGATVAAVRAVSPMPLAIQIGHAGRKASSSRPWEGGQLLGASAGGWQTVGPSAIPQLESERPPHELTIPQIKALVARFADSVERANRVGLDAIELHAAHGYLMHEFLSPIANQRTDEYGGSLENRMRLPLEVFSAMRSAWPAHKPMGVRLSCTDWLDGGWDLASTTEVSRRLERLGADWIDASSGGISPKQKIAIGPGYQVPFAQALKQTLKTAVMTVGLITEPQQAEDILTSGQADLIAMARGFLTDPRWPWRAAMALGASIDAPRQYWRVQPGTHKNLFGPTTFGTR